MKKSTFVLIDGNAILHRAYHAMPRFEADGKLVNAIYGFISILFSTIEKFQPEFLAVAFDVKGPTFRDKIFEEYKAKRVKPPREFYDQIPAVWEFLAEMEIPLLTKEGFEADDIIGTLARKINGDLGAGEVIVVTGDQDTLQLVDDRTKIAMPAMGAVKETLYDPSAVRGKFGLSPAQIIDYKALSGDPSDNIPGIRGIGGKTALALLKEYGSVEKIYKIVEKNPKEIEEKFSKNILQKLIDGKNEAFLSHDLATIRTDVPLDFKLKSAALHDFDTDKVIKFLEKFHFKSLIRRMPKSHRQNGQQEALF
jgi:DNA polymerase-1